MPSTLGSLLSASPIPLPAYVEGDLATFIPATEKQPATIPNVRFPVQFEARGVVDSSGLDAIVVDLVNSYAKLNHLKPKSAKVTEEAHQCVPYRGDSLCSHVLMIELEIEPVTESPDVIN